MNSLNIYETDNTAISVLTSIYIGLSKADIQSANDGLPSISYYAGLSADELTLTARGSLSPALTAYFTNNLNSSLTGYEFWDNIYTNLYSINAALEGISNSRSLTPAVKQQLLGEAKFMRAYYFFYLVNLYGDVPLVLTTDYKLNALMPKTSKDKIWEQIVLDLKDAENLLKQEYLDATLLKSTLEKVRPTKVAAISLLARVYLYIKDWQSAEKEATKVIENASYKLVDLDEVFKKNNDEAIWQLQPVLNYNNTNEAIAFIMIPDPVDQNNVYLSKSLLSSFEPGDLRRKHWVKSINIDDETFFFAYKYKIPRSTDPNAPVSEYSTVLRLAEQYLIRAEARIQEGKVSDGVADLNILRDRATDKSAGSVRLTQLSNTISYPDAINALEHERRLELFTEWGHRWLDLKRTGRVDNVMTLEATKKLPGGVWKSYQQLYPIGIYELQHNPKMIQNNGY